MIDIFDIQDKTVVPSIACYQIKELKAVIDTFPDEYLKVLQYIMGKTCMDSRNWYLHLSEEERDEVIITDISPFNFYLEDMVIERAITKCAKLYETPTLALSRAAKRKVYDIIRFLDEVAITGGKDGNAMDVDRFMKNIPEYQKIYKMLEKEVMEEQSVARGKIKRSYDQMPSYKYTKEDNNSQKDNI